MGNTTKAKYRTVMFDLLVIYLRLVSQSSAYISTIYCEWRISVLLKILEQGTESGKLEIFEIRGKVLLSFL